MEYRKAAFTRHARAARRRKMSRMSSTLPPSAGGRFQADRRLVARRNIVLEGRGGSRDSGRASRYDTFWFARGYLAAGSGRNSRSSRPTRGGRSSILAAVAMSNFEQHELGFPRRSAEPICACAAEFISAQPLTVANMVCGFYAVMSTLKGELSDLDTAQRPSASPSCSTPSTGLWLVRQAQAANSVNSLIRLPTW